MQGVLTWAGENPFGQVCALLLVYLVAGSIAGSALATRDEARPCWPNAVFTSIYAECDDETVGQAWLLGVSLPNSMLQGPVNLLVLATSDYREYFSVTDMVGTVFTPIIAFFGFAAWLRWAPPVAWLLLLALVGEIVYLRTLVPV